MHNLSTEYSSIMQHLRLSYFRSHKNSEALTENLGRFILYNCQRNLQKLENVKSKNIGYTTSNGHGGGNIEQTQYVLSTFPTFISFSYYRKSSSANTVSMSFLIELHTFVICYLSIYLHYQFTEDFSCLLHFQQFSCLIWSLAYSVETWTYEKWSTIWKI